MKRFPYYSVFHWGKINDATSIRHCFKTSTWASCTCRYGGVLVYEIFVLATQNRSYEIEINAKTGRIIKIEEEDDLDKKIE